MAKGKNQKKVENTASKKVGPKVSAKNVSRKILKMVRRDERSEFNIVAALKRAAARSRVIEKPQNEKERKLKDKYLAEDAREQTIAEYINKYAEAGLTRDEAMSWYGKRQKNGLALMDAKWGQKLDEFKKNQKKLGRDANSPFLIVKKAA